MDIATMRAQLRTSMEVEAEDWPDAILDASLREAYQRIIAREQRWPFFEGRWTFAALAGAGTYNLSDIGNVREITSLRINGKTLGFTDEATAEKSWNSTGTPSEWSQWGSTITLWPPPATDMNVDVRGYRTPLAFSSVAGWEPDLPSEFHSLLCDWAMANEYQRQDDPEMMTTYRTKFEEQLASLRKGAMAIPTPAPLVVGGNGRRTNYWWE